MLKYKEKAAFTQLSWRLPDSLKMAAYQTRQSSNTCLDDKDPDFIGVPTGLRLNSLTFQFMEWQFPWPYRNNNPIAQMLEIVRYIPRFILTMKHIIYEAIIKCSYGGLGENCNLPQRGLGRRPSGNRIWCILAWKSDIWWHQFFIFPDFSSKYFPMTFPW